MKKKTCQKAPSLLTIPNGTEDINNKIDGSKTEHEVKQTDESNEPPKKIEVVTGNGDLTISPVYEHLEVEKPKPKKNRKIFVPEVKGDANSSKEKDSGDEPCETDAD